MIDEKSLDFPPLTQEPVIFIDGTPNKKYPLRILKVYRANCNCRWTSGTWDNEKNEYVEKKDSIYTIMNQHQRDRAKLLDEAIKALEEYYKNDKKTPL